MPLTPIALFRMGNQAGPRMDHVRPDRDIEVYELDGELWVRAGTGGISTSGFPGPLAGRWWCLPAGYDHPVSILVRNDYARHWSWEPETDMRLADFQSLLRKSHDFFHRV